MMQQKGLSENVEENRRMNVRQQRRKAKFCRMPRIFSKPVKTLNNKMNIKKSF